MARAHAQPPGSRKGNSKGKGYPQGPRPAHARPDRPAGTGNRPAPMRFRCGKKGHLSANCTKPPMAKRRKKATDTASVVLDMTPYAEDFAAWRRSQSSAGVAPMAPGMPSGASASAAAADEDDDVNAMLEETKGCAVMDSGATVMCSSTLAAEEIQMQRLKQEELGVPTVRDSDSMISRVGGERSFSL